MPSSLSRLGSCEEINWFALGLNFISDSVDVASSRICSVHTTFPAVAARKFPWSGKLLFGTVRNSATTRTYSPVDIQSRSPSTLLVLSILSQLYFVSKEASNDPLTVQKSSAREKQAHVNEERERPSITQDYNPQRSKACEISCEGNKNQSDHWTKHMATEWHMPNVPRHASQCLCCG